MSNDNLVVKLVDLPITALDREVLMKEQFCNSLSLGVTRMTMLRSDM